MNKFNTLYKTLLEAGEYAPSSIDQTAVTSSQGKNLDWGRSSDANASGFLGDNYNGKRMDFLMKEPKILDIDSGTAHKIRRRLEKFSKLFLQLSSKLRK